MVRILVADDHAIVRKGLIQLLQRQPDFGPFGEAATAAEALAMARDQAWDLLVLDLGLPDGSGIDVLRELHRAKPRLPVLVLTMHPEDQLAVRTLRAGAAGYLTKESAPEELVRALRHILGGHKYLSPTMTQALADTIGSAGEMLPHETLSTREFEVMRLIAAGKPVKEISHRLKLSPKTVTTYRARVLRKMGMRTNAELTYYATQQGLVSAAMLRPRVTS
jgi:two-component system, NarL family, invasion response regulator UvrY